MPLKYLGKFCKHFLFLLSADFNLSRSIFGETFNTLKNKRNFHSDTIFQSFNVHNARFQGLLAHYRIGVPSVDPMLILTAPAAFVDARESRQTVRECVCVGECDRIVVNVSLDNSGLGWLTLCQEWRGPQTKSVQQSVFINLFSSLQTQ